MKVSGFTILRNGVRFAYPFEESIRSLLPLVDEMIVAVGKSDDDSLERVQAIGDPKIRIFETVWDMSKREGGLLLSEQTNIALEKCTGDWCFYLQADEVLHEDDYPAIRRAMEKNYRRKRIVGLWFDYLHFMGDYDIQNALGYQTSTRIIRNGVGLRSIRDASKFGWDHSKPLRERRPWNGNKRIGARVFHYGYVRPPKSMADKDEWGRRLYDRGSLGQAREREELSDWEYNFAACVPFRGTHQAVMKERIANRDWDVPPFRPIPLWRNPTFIKGRLRKAGLWKGRR
jgi:glycosyltransferase involved in cell wall biosynthesis